jgi:circadian clock protein KaiB
MTETTQAPLSGEDPAVESAAEPAAAPEVMHLRLYVAGMSPKSLEAFANLKKLCETHLTTAYEIEIVDLLEHPSLARGDDIIAVPTVVKDVPAPMRKVIGDLSDTERVLLGLQLVSKQS